MLPVTEHFNQPNHTIHDVRVTGVCQLYRNETNRRNTEMRIIDRLGSRYPRGINKKFMYLV